MSTKRHSWEYIGKVLGIIAFAALLAVLLCSCKSAKWCAQRYPVEVKTVTNTYVADGETVYVYDTVTADCDEVLTEWARRYGMGEQAKEVIATGASKIRVPCPPSSHRVDTLKVTNTVTVENTHERDEYKADAARLRRGRNTWRWIGGSFILLAVGGVVWKVLSWKVSKVL